VSVLGRREEIAILKAEAVKRLRSELEAAKEQIGDLLDLSSEQLIRDIGGVQSRITEIASWVAVFRSYEAADRAEITRVNPPLDV